MESNVAEVASLEKVDAGRSGPADSHTRKLVSYIVDTRYEAIDGNALQAALRPIVDTIGVILAGLGSDAGAGMIAYARQQSPVGAGSGAAGAWVPIPGVAVSAEVAACVNGTLAHSLDYDDTVLGAGHPSGVVLPALLGALDPALPARGGVPLLGRELLEAYAIGFDVHVKMARALGLKHYKHGWHTTSTAGAFAATAALAHARRLPHQTVAVALGMTASMISGIQRNFGTCTKPLHSGLAARAGVMACDLAAVGFSATDDVFDGKRSVLEMYGLGEADPHQFELLGAPHALIDPGVALKKYSACFTTHRAIEAAMRLCVEHDIRPADVESVRCFTPIGALMYLVKRAPRTALEGKFSVEYLIACAIVDRAVGFESFTDEAVRRPAIVELLPRIVATEEARCRPEDPEGLRSSPATGGFIEVHIKTRAGAEFVKRVDAPEGAVEHPMAWDSIGEKFVDCARYGGIRRDKAQAAFTALRDLDKVPDVHAVLRSLTS